MGGKTKTIDLKEVIMSLNETYRKWWNEMMTLE